MILDDVQDLQFLVEFQHVFQGKPDEEITFAETQSGTRAYSKLLFATPFVATLNNGAHNLEFLDKHDFLGNPANRVILYLTEPPYEDDGDDGEDDIGTRVGPALPVTWSPTPPSRESLMSEMMSWSVSRTCCFMQNRDLHATARLFKDNDASGADLVEMTADGLTQSFRCSSFLARKIVKARDDFLDGVVTE